MGIDSVIVSQKMSKSDLLSDVCEEVLKMKCVFNGMAGNKVDDEDVNAAVDVLKKVSKLFTQWRNAYRWKLLFINQKMS